MFLRAAHLSQPNILHTYHSEVPERCGSPKITVSRVRYFEAWSSTSWGYMMPSPSLRRSLLSPSIITGKRSPWPYWKYRVMSFRHYLSRFGVNLSNRGGTEMDDTIFSPSSVPRSEISYARTTKSGCRLDQCWFGFAVSYSSSVNFFFENRIS